MMPQRKPCVNCGADTPYFALTMDDWCPKCDMLRGANTLREDKPSQIPKESREEIIKQMLELLVKLQNLEGQ